MRNSSAFEDSSCPQCGVEMEPIETGVQELPIQELQLCPRCYLVTWSDKSGMHVRQGVPMTRDARPRTDPHCLVGEPREC